MARTRPRWRAAAVALMALAGVSCGQGSEWAGETAAREARVTASEGASGDGLAQALKRHVKALSDDIGERSVVRGDGLDRARAYVHGAFEAAGLHVSEQVYSYGGREVANVIAELPGADTNAAPYVIGAHYDSVIGTPGADDNASAIAVMLELARVAREKPPAAPVRFIAFTLEEPPTHATRHQGSRVYVERLKETGATVAAAIILEMVGLTTAKQHYPLFLNWAGYPEAGNYIGVVGNRRSKPLGERLLAAMGANAKLPVESLFVWFDGWVLADTRLSDHAPFWDAGIPALMITDTAYFRNPHYHGPGDTWDTLDYGFMAELVRSLTLVLDALDPAP